MMYLQQDIQAATLAARRVYYWPIIHVDIDRYVTQCISCAKHKGTIESYYYNIKHENTNTYAAAEVSCVFSEASK